MLVVVSCWCFIGVMLVTLLRYLAVIMVVSLFFDLCLWYLVAVRLVGLQVLLCCVWGELLALCSVSGFGLFMIYGVTFLPVGVACFGCWVWF